MIQIEFKLVRNRQQSFLKWTVSQDVLVSTLQYVSHVERREQDLGRVEGACRSNVDLAAGSDKNLESGLSFLLFTDSRVRGGGGVVVAQVMRQPPKRTPLAVTFFVRRTINSKIESGEGVLY